MFALLTDPAAWMALVTLIVMEVVLGIDNLVFIAILSNKLPEGQRARVRRVGISLALVLRIALLFSIFLIVGMVKPVFDFGLQSVDASGHVVFETAFSVRDLILIAGGVFLLYKATKEIHHSVAPEDAHESKEPAVATGGMSFASAIVQILALDLVFSVDSILTAVGMTDELPIMIAAVIVAVGAMMFAANPLGNFIAKNPSVVMLALGFLLMIGLVLVADGFGVHVPKGYVYTAMAFSGLVEGLNLWARKRRARATTPSGH